MTAGAPGPTRQGAAPQAEEGPQVDTLDPAGRGHRRPRLPAESGEGLPAGAAVRWGLVGSGQSGDSLDGESITGLELPFCLWPMVCPWLAEQARLPPLLAGALAPLPYSLLPGSPPSLSG